MHEEAFLNMPLGECIQTQHKCLGGNVCSVLRITLD